MPTTKPAKRSKNRLHLDVTLGRHFSISWLAYVSLTLIFAWLAGLPWWALMLLIALAVALSLLRHFQVKLTKLSCHHIDELWDIGVNMGQKHALWQGYLADARTLHTPLKAVFLSFHVVEPRRQKLDVIIHRHQVDDANFRKLLGICVMDASKFG